MGCSCCHGDSCCLRPSDEGMSDPQARAALRSTLTQACLNRLLAPELDSSELDNLEFRVSLGFLNLLSEPGPSRRPLIN